MHRGVVTLIARTLQPERRTVVIEQTLHKKLGAGADLSVALKVDSVEMEPESTLVRFTQCSGALHLPGRKPARQVIPESWDGHRDESESHEEI